MSVLTELTASQGIERALTILLKYGFENKYYKNWQEYVGEEYEEYDEDYDGYALKDREGCWTAIAEYVPRKKIFSDGELEASIIGDQDGGPAHDSEVYYVVLSLSDGKDTRYFKRDGYYASYDGGHLADGEDSEVLPVQVTVTDFKEI